jgi:hypothetical protein
MKNLSIGPERRVVQSPLLLKRLNELHDWFGPAHNRNASCMALIGACISEGLTSRSNILLAMDALGYHPRHVSTILSKGAGSDPARSLWRREASDRYRLNT